MKKNDFKMLTFSLMNMFLVLPKNEMNLHFELFKLKTLDMFKNCVKVLLWFFC